VSEGGASRRALQPQTFQSNSGVWASLSNPYRWFLLTSENVQINPKIVKPLWFWGPLYAHNSFERNVITDHKKKIMKPKIIMETNMDIREKIFYYKRPRKYSLLTGGAKMLNRQGSLHTLLQ